MVCSVRYDLDLTDVTLVCKDGKQVEALLVMVEFLYSGDANIDQENLDEFLADELGLKDFNGTCEEGGVNTTT